MHPRSRLKRPAYVYKRRGIITGHQSGWKEVLKNFLKTHRKKIIYLVIIFVVIMALIPPATYLYFAKDLKDKESIMNRGKTGLTLMDHEGKVFYTFYQPKSISYIDFSDIPKTAEDAVIATEDKNFYTNGGFSVRGIMRAMFVNLLAGKVVEGGSTITQELAKNAFLSQSRNILRKYQELVLATELNRRFNKEDILEMYLNSVYFGEGAFGLENASQAYFGKHAKQLDLAESALLIGILPAPSAYSPLSNPPDKAIKRQQIVLSEMVQDGYITQDQATTAEKEELKYNPNKVQNNTFMAPHFATYVRDQLIQEYGEERVIRDGFQVTTTMDRKLQEYAQDVVKNQVSRLQYNHTSNGAAVAIDPKNGHILAMVGSYNWDDPKFGQTNMAVIPRQPGSSFKPIIYGRGIEDKKITAATILQDVATTFNGGYKPLDYDKRFRGDVTVRRALANSLNIPAVEVMEKVGDGAGRDQAKKMGITTLDLNRNYGLSLVLGTAEVPLLQMTGAYGAFADQGTYHPTTGILSVKDKNNQTLTKPTSFFSFLNPLNWFTNSSDGSSEAISQEAAYIVSSILSDNNARAEEFGSALTINRPAAVKTGTTEDFRDALTIGYTPSLVVGVWVGNNDNTPMDDIAGSLGAAPIWRSIMEYQLMGTEVEPFDKPTFIISETVCPQGNYRSYTEYFIAGTQENSCGQPTTAPTFTPGPTSAATPTQAAQPTAIPQTTNTPIPTPTSAVTPTSTTAFPTVKINTP